MLIFFSFIPWFYAGGNVSNRIVTIKFAQIHYFLSQNVGGNKMYYLPPCPKVGGYMFSYTPINLVPAYDGQIFPQNNLLT